MKKAATFLLVLACVLLFPMHAKAVQSDNNESLSPNVGQFENIWNLYMHWETEGYPDYVGFVYSTDGSENNLTVLLVGDGGTTESQIRSMLIDDSGLSFGTAKYSYNELNAVAEEIVDTYLLKNEQNEQFHSVGVGWTSVDGEVTGFGESGKEPRVCVGVDQEIINEYAEQFGQRYGDKVVLETSEGIVLQAAVQTDSTPNSLWLLIPAAFLVGVGVVFFVRVRRVPALQTTTGSVVAKSAPVGTKQVTKAIKDSEIVPSDEVFESILSKINKKNVR